VIEDVAGLLWVINLGCIDLNPWYARCDDVQRPDVLHFDIDPVKGAGTEQTTPFSVVREAALVLRDALRRLELPCYAKTTGSAGIHVYVPIVRDLVQHDVWRVAKAFAFALAQQRPDILTAEYTIAKRPAGRVLVDYNQNAWGRTLASAYSVRAKPDATVSAPVSWEELERGISMEDFTIETMPERLATAGDLWAPVLARKGRAKLDHFLSSL
jgi:bifunctional non-homologous end joining protein LigD